MRLAAALLIAYVVFSTPAAILLGMHAGFWPQVGVLGFVMANAWVMVGAIRMLRRQGAPSFSDLFVGIVLSFAFAGSPMIAVHVLWRYGHSPDGPTHLLAWLVAALWMMCMLGAQRLMIRHAQNLA